MQFGVQVTFEHSKSITESQVEVMKGILNYFLGPRTLKVKVVTSFALCTYTRIFVHSSIEYFSRLLIFHFSRLYFYDFYSLLSIYINRILPLQSWRVAVAISSSSDAKEPRCLVEKRDLKSALSTWIKTCVRKMA